MLTPTSSYSVSPDGKRIALIRTSQTGQQIVTFTTARPNDVTTVVDLAGSGELTARVIWAGDGSDNLLFDAVKETHGSGGGDNATWEYSALRSVDLATRTVREVVRIGGQNTKLRQLAWLPARQLAGALEMRQLGPVANFVRWSRAACDPSIREHLLRDTDAELREPSTMAPPLIAWDGASRRRVL